MPQALPRVPECLSPSLRLASEEGADGLGSRAGILALGPLAFHYEGLLPVCNPQPAARSPIAVASGFRRGEASKPRDPCLPLRKASRIFRPSLFHLLPLPSHWRW